jgi:hypothetical protein
MYKRIAMNSARNKHHRFCLALVVSMLFCGLSAIEIPEFTRLVDDTSNDFTLVDAAQSPSAVAYQSSLSVVRTVSQNRILDRIELRIQRPVASPTSYHSSDYLELICIHRT